MGVRIYKNAFGSTVGDECFIDRPDGTTLRGAGVELAVRKSTRTTFAEAIVGVFDYSTFFQDGT